MGLFDAMRIARSGMNVERFRIDVTSLNIANANTSRSSAGTAGDPWRRQNVILQSGENGPQVVQMVSDPSDWNKKSVPGHKFADAQGFVDFSNVNPIVEMVDMMTASRSYEANVAAFNTARGMVRAALEIGRA